MFLLIPALGVAANQDERGLLPEVRLDSKDESLNEKRALQSEILISKAETQAIESLQKLIKKRKGSTDEADLLHRLAELYMRRAKTGRFLDLHANSKSLQLSSFPLPNVKGTDWIRKASNTYSEIEKRFPRYRELDAVIFNNAFALQQLGQIKGSEQAYERMIAKFPQSRLVPDAAAALGELAYDQRRFALALNHFEKASQFKDSKVFTYSLYKMAWSHYNLKNSDAGVEKLLEVVKECPPLGQEDATTETRRRQNLRREALRDLALFVSDSKNVDELYPFFKKITTEEELGLSMLDLAKLYLSHSKHKEMNSFLSEFLKKHEASPSRVRVTLALVEANEALKQRPQVLDYLEMAATACRPDSRWRARQNEETLTDACETGFQNKSLEIASKWWDIWKKNSKNTEFASLTEKALKIVLDNEDVNKPDLSSRFAYAELLFQLGRFAEAADNYHQVGEKDLADQKRRHDADYGALFATEKALAAKKTPLLEAQRKDYALTYLKRHPKGDHVGDVTFKVAFLSSEEGDLVAAEQRMQPLLKGDYGRVLQRKAEDLHLDLLNQKKDYKALASRAEAYLRLEGEPTRKTNLKKIQVEADYAHLQEDVKTLPKDQAVSRLKGFSEAHPDSPLSSDALWQGAAMAFLEGRGLEGARLIETFAKKNPKDPRLVEALKGAAQASAEAGDLRRAAQLLDRLSDLDAKGRASHLEAAADFHLLENEISQARKLYHQILVNAPQDQRGRLYNKLMSTYQNEPEHPEVRKLEELVLSQNMEPFATQVLTKRAHALLAAGRKPEAFEAARKIMSRSAPAELRAEARLIQARILESEFLAQSVKSTREDKFGMVLALKTEKLEKAQTAYLSASKMSSDSKILMESFAGIDRSYAHYVESLERLEPPPTLSQADQMALKEELQKILVPLREKREENRQQIRKIASVASSTTHRGQIPWDDLSGETAPPPAALLPVARLSPYVPANWPQEGLPKRVESAKKGSCDAKKPNFAACLLLGQLDVAEKIAQDLTQNKDSKVQGWHHLALVAEAQGKKTKALWLLGLAEKQSPRQTLVNYEKGRLLENVEGLNAGSADFVEVVDSEMNSTETRILRALRAFSEGDFKSATTHFSGIKKEELYNLNLGLLLSECFAAQGDPEKALKVIEEIAATQKAGKSSELYIQQGRIHETYKFAPVPALESYEKALRLAKDPAQKEWLNRKKEYLKVNFKVGQHVSSAD